MDVRLVERDEVRQVRELVVCFQQVRSRLLDDVQYSFEVARRTRRVLPCDGDLSELKVRAPNNGWRSVLNAKRLLIQSRGDIDLPAAERNHRAVEYVVDRIAVPCRRPEALRFLVVTLGLVPLPAINVRLSEIAGPQRRVRRDASIACDLECTLQVRHPIVD